MAITQMNHQKYNPEWITKNIIQKELSNSIKHSKMGQLF